MTPYYALYEAKKRLVMTKETIHMMGGEDECQPMLLGQRDMLELEIDYHREQSVKFTVVLVALVAAFMLGWHNVDYIKGLILHYVK